MRRTRARRLGILLAIGALLTTVGCGQREPNPDELVLYIKSARVGGKVRRQWPEGQQYLDTVLRADAVYRRAVTGLLELRTPTGLWETDDGRWRDPDAVTQALDARNQLLTDGAATARASALETLTAAVGQPPSGVDPVQVWAALAWDGQEIQEIETSLPALLELARQQVALLELVQRHQDSFDQAEGRTGLTYSDAAAQDAVLSAHAALQAIIDANQRDFEAYVLAGFDDAEGRFEALTQEKQALKAAPDAPQKQKKLRALEDRIDYQMARRKHFEDHKKDLKKTDSASGGVSEGT
ncbi:MAG: hypothetical protein ACYSW1_11815 [Planctomycetota bacterium]|jgi:hypothetical protein